MKRIITSLVVVLFMMLSVEAQYYYKPYTYMQRHTDHPGYNPGLLNTDPDNTVGATPPAGWTTIDNGTAATARWTAVRALPFAFNLNGVPVTHFKVSTSGVLTFDTATALAAPSYTNAAIPSANIPDKSVMVWGLSATASGDKMITRTFGTAPNQQLWVSFAMYSVPGAATSCYSYWSIVLEETTNKIYLVDQRNSTTSACNPTLTVGIQVDQTTAYFVSNSPNVADFGGETPLVTDNVYYEFINGTKPAVDANLFTLTVEKYKVPPATVTLGGKLINHGASNITAFDFKYAVGGTEYVKHFTGLSIAPGITYTFSHSDLVNIPGAGRVAIRAWIDADGDADLANNTMITATHGLSYTPPKKVLFEEATGTWCGWCPRGTVFMDSLHAVYPNTAMLIAVHNGDPMTVAAYDAGMGYEIGGYPSGLIDRKTMDVDPSSFFGYYTQRMNDKAPCEVSVITNFDAVTRVLQTTVKAHFATELEGDYRFNGVVVEDDVTGLSATYAMTNYYSGYSPPLIGGGHNWYTEPNPVPAASMEYDHVARAIFGGMEGLAGSLPPNIPDGTDQYYTFSYTLPAALDPADVHVIGWVSDAVTGNVLNSNISPNNSIVGINEAISENFEVRVYPNPVTSGMSKIRINLKKNAKVIVDMVDVTGRSVYSNTQKTLAQGEYIYPLDMSTLSNGLYNITVNVDGEQITKRIIVQQ